MAVPKHKTSKSRRDKRRTHQKTAAPTITTCPACGEARLPHFACAACGEYNGRKIKETTQKK